jgi:hypothetical protein
VCLYTTSSVGCVGILHAYMHVLSHIYWQHITCMYVSHTRKNVILYEVHKGPLVQYAYVWCKQEAGRRDKASDVSSPPHPLDGWLPMCAYVCAYVCLCVCPVSLSRRRCTLSGRHTCLPTEETSEPRDTHHLPAAASNGDNAERYPRYPIVDARHALSLHITIGDPAHIPPKAAYGSVSTRLDALLPISKRVDIQCRNSAPDLRRCSIICATLITSPRYCRKEQGTASSTTYSCCGRRRARRRVLIDIIQHGR